MFGHRYDKTKSSRGAKRIIRDVTCAMRGGDIDWQKLMRRMPMGEEWELQDWARQIREALPIPASFEEYGQSWGLRTIERFIAEIYAHEGNPLPLVELLRTEFLHCGDSGVELLELLVELGRTDEADLLSRMAIERGGSDREVTRGIHEALTRAPNEWIVAVSQLADGPSVDGWKKVLERLPNDNIFYGPRDIASLIVDLGGDYDDIFASATANGMSDEAQELLEWGLIEPAAVASRGVDGDADLWYAWAVKAAAARSDDEAVEAYTALALIVAPEPRHPLHEVFSEADEELRQRMLAVGYSAESQSSRA